ncbi:MAG: hypothetical protein JWO38_1387 [Gemmataceae bacterium]|nr:hypothetical protein [Gemmataceae bacterium]
MEVVGEFLGLDHDKVLFAHFARYHEAEFPGMARVCRTTFARQAASLYAVMHALHKHLATRLAADEPVWQVDSLPVEVGKFARAKYCQRLKGGRGVRVRPQLAERFHVKRTWGRDLWHLSHRVIRKVLGHTVAVWINLTLGHPWTSTAWRRETPAHRV